MKYKEIETFKNKSKCIICRNYKDNGIIIAKELICNNCYNELVKLQVNDKKYDYYKEKIKQALINSYNIN